MLKAHVFKQSYYLNISFFFLSSVCSCQYPCNLMVPEAYLCLDLNMHIGVRWVVEYGRVAPLDHQQLLHLFICT
jgi:hypothetical protein